MGRIQDKVSFLRGLTEGMELSKETREGKLLHHIIDALDVIAQEHERLDRDLSELTEFVESIDEDLLDAENRISIIQEETEDLEDDDDLEETDDDDEETDFSGHSYRMIDDDASDIDSLEIICPHCQQEAIFSLDQFEYDEKALCPHCNQSLFDIPDDHK